MKALIVNYTGIGDGIIEFPFLRHMQATFASLRFFHTSGLIFEDASIDAIKCFPSCDGLVSSGWRNFAEKDWFAINAFLESNAITDVINFRVIGESYSDSYLRFKKRYSATIKFADLASNDENETNIRGRIARLLNTHFAIDGPRDRHGIDSLARSTARRKGLVGLNIHSGNRLKSWPYRKWLELGAWLTRQGFRLAVFPGFSEDESNKAAALVSDLFRQGHSRITIPYSNDVRSSLHLLNSMEFVVSVDSWLIHAAAALRVNAIGLYIVTCPHVWGGDSERFWPVESTHLRQCANFDPHLGICRNGYKPCPSISEHGDGIAISDVKMGIELMLARRSD